MGLLADGRRRREPQTITRPVPVLIRPAQAATSGTLTRPWLGEDVEGLAAVLGGDGQIAAHGGEVLRPGGPGWPSNRGSQRRGCCRRLRTVGTVAGHAWPQQTAPEEEAMPGRLEGKISLITGVGGAVGRASALLFAAEGATVIGCDREDGA